MFIQVRRHIVNLVIQKKRGQSLLFEKAKIIVTDENWKVKKEFGGWKFHQDMKHWSYYLDKFYLPISEINIPIDNTLSRLQEKVTAKR